MINLSDLKAHPKSRKRRKVVGRGFGSGHGTFSGRGAKGQKARSGGKSGLKRRGLRQLLKNKPKIGGFKSLKPKFIKVNIDSLEKSFEAGELVNIKKLIAKNLIKKNISGLKILGNGRLTKKLTVIADDFSESAKKAIIKAGGKTEVRDRQK